MKVNFRLTTFWKIPLEGLSEKPLGNLLADYQRKQRKKRGFRLLHLMGT